MKWLLLKLPSGTYRAGVFIKAAIKLGLEIIVGSDHKQVLSNVYEDKTLFLPLWNESRGVANIQEFANKKPIYHVIGVDEQSVVIAAEANELLGIPDNASEVVQATRDKYLMRKVLDTGEVCIPDYNLFELPTYQPEIGIQSP